MVEELLGNAGLNQKDIDLVVPHQTLVPLDALGRMGFEPDRVVNLVDKIGSCSGVTPMALATKHKDA